MRFKTWHSLWVKKNKDNKKIGEHKSNESLLFFMAAYLMVIMMMLYISVLWPSYDDDDDDGNNEIDNLKHMCVCLCYFYNNNFLNIFTLPFFISFFFMVVTLMRLFLCLCVCVLLYFYVNTVLFRIWLGVCIIIAV